MEKVICKKVGIFYFCKIGGKPYKAKKVIVNGREIDENEITLIDVEVAIKGDVIEISKKEKKKSRKRQRKEVSPSPLDEIYFLKEYYRNPIPTPEEMRKARKILAKYTEPKERQRIYLEVIGGRPHRNAICIYDEVDESYMEKLGFEPKKVKKGDIYAFVKKGVGKTIWLGVKPKDGKYLVDYINIYTKDRSRNAICVYDMKAVTITGEEI